MNDSHEMTEETTQVCIEMSIFIYECVHLHWDRPAPYFSDLTEAKLHRDYCV